MIPATACKKSITCFVVTCFAFNIVLISLTALTKKNSCTSNRGLHSKNSYLQFYTRKVWSFLVIKGESYFSPFLSSCGPLSSDVLIIPHFCHVFWRSSGVPVNMMTWWKASWLSNIIEIKKKFLNVWYISQNSWGILHAWNCNRLKEKQSFTKHQVLKNKYSKSFVTVAPAVTRKRRNLRCVVRVVQHEHEEEHEHEGLLK